MAVDLFAQPEHAPFCFEAGSRHAVLLLHGFMGTPAELRPLGQALAEAGVTARGILLPGFGSDLASLGQVTRADWLRAARDAWDELERTHPQVSVVGFSMGAAVALRLAGLRPVHRLALIAPLYRLMAGDPRVRALPVVKRVVREFRPFAKADFSDPAVRSFFQGSMAGFDLDDPTTQQALREQAVLHTATLDELRRVALESAGWARRLHAPTLVVQGLDDDTVRAADTRELIARVEAPLSYQQFPGGHLLTDATRPSWPRVRDAVVSFLASDGGAG